MQVIVVLVKLRIILKKGWFYSCSCEIVLWIWSLLWRYCWREDKVEINKPSFPLSIPVLECLVIYLWWKIHGRLFSTPFEMSCPPCSLVTSNYDISISSSFFACQLSVNVTCGSYLQQPLLASQKLFFGIRFS